jgi:hypothetical protein
MKRLATCVALAVILSAAESRLADRSRIVKARQEYGKTARYHDNGRPIEGPSYRSRRADAEKDVEERINAQTNQKPAARNQQALWKIQPPKDGNNGDVQMLQRQETPEEFERKLSSQLTGCCYTYQSYSASYLCASYGQDCESGETPSHDDEDDDCTHDGLSFVGLSFSVNTANGNPYSYQLCDQFPMENIIDRKYDYIMSIDEDGWLVGGGYKTFDYSGKMP